MLLNGIPIKRTFSPTLINGCQLWLEADRVRIGAAQFVAARSEYLSIADNPTLSTGDVDYWFMVPVLLDSVAASQCLLGKDKSGSREYYLEFNSGTGQFSWNVFGAQSVNAVTFGTPAVGSWHFVFVYHDAVNDLVGISVDGGAFDTAATTGPSIDSTAFFAIGSREWLDIFLSGRICNVAFGKSPPGGIAAIAATIASTLYNSGRGVDLSAISAATKTAWGAVSAWPLTEASGQRNDVWSTNHLTDNNTVMAAPGLLNTGTPTIPADGVAISTAGDLSGIGHNLLQATEAAQYLNKLAIQAGKAAARFDGVNDYAKATAFTLNQPCTIVIAADFTNLADGAYVFDGNTANSGALYRSGTNLVMNAGVAAPSIARPTGDAIVTCVFNGANSSIQVNGATAQTGDAGAANPGGFTLASDGGAPTAGTFAQIDVFAALGWNRALNAGELNRLHLHLGRKYGIGVT